MSVALEVYRTVVSYAERGLRVERVDLPLVLYERLAPADKAWLFEHAGVMVEAREGLTEPVFVFK